MNFYRKKRATSHLPFAIILLAAVLYFTFSHSVQKRISVQVYPSKSHAIIDASELGALKVGSLFSVVVDHRHHCMARKLGNQQYIIEYANKGPYMQVGHTVYTTGLDRQIPPDILIGEIGSIQSHPNQPYDDIKILSQSHSE